jgi:3-oxoacyl-[acyl-carrier-protein] synthase-3
VVSRDGPVRIRDLLVETSGAYWDLFQVDYRDRPSFRWREECTSYPRHSFQLAVETRNRLQALAGRALRGNGLRPEDVACYLSQNLSTSTFQVYEELFGMSIAETCLANLRSYGHLGPNDILLNLYRAIEQGKLPDGGRALVLNASPAAAWSVLVVENGNPTVDGARAHYL